MKKYISKNILQKIGSQISTALGIQKFGSVGTAILQAKKSEDHSILHIGNRDDLHYATVADSETQRFKQFIAENTDKYNLRYRDEKQRAQLNLNELCRSVQDNVIIDSFDWIDDLL